jgi:Protein of unknown function (DUF1566)
MEIPSRGVIARVGWLLVTTVCPAGGCQKNEPAPVAAVTAPADAARRRPAEAPRHVATPEAWASWPMPNTRSPGLPNPHSYDTQSDDVVVDRITGLMWQRILSGKFLTLADAERDCDRLTLGGHDDWRLPSRIELVSLLDTARIQPSIDIDAFPGTPNDWFWTSSPDAADPTSAWYVYFYFGYPKTDNVTNTFSVRCVRRAQPRAAPPARYDIQADEVRDVASGLLWQRAVGAKTGSFESARAYCRRLSLAGNRHWRVPTLVELLTLIDERATAPMVDRAAFPDTPPEPFWTSSTFASGTELAWFVRFDQGSALYGRLSESFRVRCVL